MKLLESLSNLCEENLTATNDWYNWRNINETLIPDDIILPKGNQYVKNIYLKKALHSKWKNDTSAEKKGVLIEYYIRTWGGIKGNNADSMQEFLAR